MNALLLLVLPLSPPVVFFLLPAVARIGAFSQAVRRATIIVLWGIGHGDAVLIAMSINVSHATSNIEQTAVRITPVVISLLLLTWSLWAALDMVAGPAGTKRTPRKTR